MFDNKNNKYMATYSISLDKRTLFGKNMYNFLVGMNYVNKEVPNVADIDERTSDGRKIKKVLYELGILENIENEKDKEKEELSEIFSSIKKGTIETRSVDQLLGEL